MIKGCSPSTPRIPSLAHLTQWPLSTAYNTRRAAAFSHASTRIYPVRALAQHPHRRPFHSSPHLLAQRTHYDVLGVPPTTTKADLKKRFYVLSKETHPDMNRNDPKASERFAEVSEAYAILGNDEKRKKYDREVMPRPSRSSQRSGGAKGTYAGSRPATGLSTRRGTFRGPPPSFYAQSGQSANPSAEEYARREQQAYNQGAPAGAFDPRQYAAPGHWDPTFNSDPVYKTQTAEDSRRTQRRAAEMAAAQAYAEEQGNFWARFIVVSGVVAFGVGVGTMINRMSASPRGGLLTGDGTRRDKSTIGR
ncbi:hypothetical protein LTR64_006978 [Lithohypha guttulata]|uniref:uncharacterized protein n=1 Tax=Lithohypha guttulata TaxID=1690604 RepID=UPI002DDFEB1A|nr:hypothetical protein LTR51_004464 [Lithohypha guttulata]